MKTLSQQCRYSFNSKGFIAALIFAVTFFSVNAQTSDSMPKPARNFKNSIKLNITSRIIYDNSFQLSYERVIKKNQSINIFGGYNELPVNVNLNLANAELKDTKSKSGYSLGIDYRFYLSKENKYDAPHGVYLAPFVSYYHFQTNRVLSYTNEENVTSSTDMQTRVNFFNIGGELGYQFVLGKRWTIDAVVFGPAITSYYFNAKLASDIPGLDTNEALQAAIDALKEKFPKLNDLTGDQGINKKGTEAFWGIGFRYNISVGFRF